MIRFNAHFGELTTRRKHNKYGVSVIQYPSRVIELEYLFKKSGDFFIRGLRVTP